MSSRLTPCIPPDRPRKQTPQSSCRLRCNSSRRLWHFSHHLTEGRLFLLESDPTFRSSKTKAPEYFWLCKGSSTGMTLRLVQNGKVTATGLREALRNGPQVAFASVNRQNGLLLRSVNFLRTKTTRRILKTSIDDLAMPYVWEHPDEIVAAASNCPALGCGSLVIEYSAADNIRPGHAEDWDFTCPRCGIEFTGAQGELIFQSVPKQWLSANTHVV